MSSSIFHVHFAYDLAFLHLAPPSWYGWSAQAKLHWIMPIIGSGIFGFGEMRVILRVHHAHWHIYVQGWWPLCTTPSVEMAFCASADKPISPSFFSLPVSLYLVDAFKFAASAMAAASVSNACITMVRHAEGVLPGTPVGDGICISAVRTANVRCTRHWWWKLGTPFLAMMPMNINWLNCW